MNPTIAFLFFVSTASILTSISRDEAFPAGVAPAPYATRTKLTQPRLFGEGVISTADDEIGGSFSPDGRDFYFAKRTPGTITSSLVAICVSHYENGKWGKPEIASFSGQYLDFSPSLSPDGSKLFFSSVRPSDGKNRLDTDIWFVEKGADDKWGEPH